MYAELVGGKVSVDTNWHELRETMHVFELHSS